MPSLLLPQNGDFVSRVPLHSEFAARCSLGFIPPFLVNLYSLYETLPPRAAQEPLKLPAHVLSDPFNTGESNKEAAARRNTAALATPAMVTTAPRSCGSSSSSSSGDTTSNLSTKSRESWRISSNVCNNRITVVRSGSRGSFSHSSSSEAVVPRKTPLN